MSYTKVRLSMWYNPLPPIMPTKTTTIQPQIPIKRDHVDALLSPAASAMMERWLMVVRVRKALSMPPVLENQIFRIRSANLSNLSEKRELTEDNNAFLMVSCNLWREFMAPHVEDVVAVVVQAGVDIGAVLTGINSVHHVHPL